MVFDTDDSNSVLIQARGRLRKLTDELKQLDEEVYLN